MQTAWLWISLVLACGGGALAAPVPATWASLHPVLPNLSGRDAATLALAAANQDATLSGAVGAEYVALFCSLVAPYDKTGWPAVAVGLVSATCTERGLSFWLGLGFQAALLAAGLFAARFGVAVAREPVARRYAMFRQGSALPPPAALPPRAKATKSASSKKLSAASASW
jgi:hypothetical protein